MISTTVTSDEGIQSRTCYLPIQISPRIKLKRITCMKISTLISIYSIFLGTKKKIHDEKKKVISKMKDELNGDIIEEFVGLRAKCIQ